MKNLLLDKVYEMIIPAYLQFCYEFAKIEKTLMLRTE